MGYMFQLSDEEYTKLAVYAKQHKQTPEMLFKSWVDEMTHRVKEPTAASQKQQIVHSSRLQECLLLATQAGLIDMTNFWRRHI
jgi:hypothetical protein